MTTALKLATAATVFAALTTAANAQTAPTAASSGDRRAGTDAAFGPAVSENDLGRVVGRDDIGAMVASATQRNTVANNSVVGTSTTGQVSIDGNAFQNLQGLAVISANSGNNVAMNAAMNVTVNIAPR